MNKELIKNYKKEFDHWLNSGSVSIFDIGCNAWLDCVNPWESSGHQSIKHIVINDEYVAFRKALCEGKTVQFLSANKNETFWIDVDSSYFNGIGTNYLRIKPEEHKFKVGDWVVEKSTGEIKQIKIIPGDDEESKLALYERLCVKWQPKEGEWCWFYNRHTEVPLLRRFEYIFNGRFYTNDEIMFDICEPFIGELPSFLKDKQCVILK